LLTATLHPEQGSSIVACWPPTKCKCRATVHGRRHAAVQHFLYQEAFHQTAPPNNLPPRPALFTPPTTTLRRNRQSPFLQVTLTGRQLNCQRLPPEDSLNVRSRPTSHRAARLEARDTVQWDGFGQMCNRLDRCSAAISQRRSACGALLKSFRPQTRRPRRGEGHTKRFNCLSMALPQHGPSGNGPVRRCRCSLARPRHSPGRGRGRQGCCCGRHRANYSRAAAHLPTACRPTPTPALSTRTTPFQESPPPTGVALGFLSRVARESAAPVCHVLTSRACLPDPPNA